MSASWQSEKTLVFALKVVCWRTVIQQGIPCSAPKHIWEIYAMKPLTVGYSGGEQGKQDRRNDRDSNHSHSLVFSVATENVVAVVGGIANPPLADQRGKGSILYCLAGTHWSWAQGQGWRSREECAEGSGFCWTARIKNK